MSAHSRGSDQGPGSPARPLRTVLLLLAALLVGSVPGILIGARLSKRVPEVATRSLLVGALGFAGVKLVA